MPTSNVFPSFSSSVASKIAWFRFSSLFFHVNHPLHFPAHMCQGRKFALKYVFVQALGGNRVLFHFHRRQLTPSGFAAAHKKQPFWRYLEEPIKSLLGDALREWWTGEGREPALLGPNEVSLDFFGFKLARGQEIDDGRGKRENQQQIVYLNSFARSSKISNIFSLFFLLLESCFSLVCGISVALVPIWAVAIDAPRRS